MGRLVATAVVITGLAQFAPRLAPLATAQQIPPAVDDRFAGLQWTFARVRYGTYAGESRSNLRIGYWDEPWAIDAPAAEQNLTRRLRSVTAIEVTEPVVITMDDEKIWQYPWLYLVEPSNLLLNEKEIVTLREHLLRGGTLTLDDFHGPYEWDLTVRQLKLIFPDREIVDIPDNDPVFHVAYDLDEHIQIPGIQSLYSGLSYERDGFEPHWRGIYDDQGRLMVVINFNMDLGDAWEHADVPEYSLLYTTRAYKYAINYILYAMTH